MKMDFVMLWRNFAMCNLRIGQGFDIHKLAEDRKLILGGVQIPYEKGLLGHSDADCLIHAIIDAIFGALALGDIGSHFPDTDLKYKDVNSVFLLEEALNLMRKKGYEIVNLDTTIKAQAPKMRPYIDEIRNNLAKVMKVSVENISVKAKTMEELGVVGEHNILNSLSVIALMDLLHIEETTVLSALKSFNGTERRFEYKGAIAGVTVLDDYAHHPTEIEATLKAAANYPHNTLWCVFQPHTYTRTNAFLKDFAQVLTLADKVILTDIYAAREKNTIGITSLDLQREIEKLGKECFYFPSFDEVENFLLENCINGDLLITMGAGDVVKIGENLLGI